MSGQGGARKALITTPHGRQVVTMPKTFKTGSGGRGGGGGSKKGDDSSLQSVLGLAVGTPGAPGTPASSLGAPGTPAFTGAAFAPPSVHRGGRGGSGSAATVISLSSSQIPADALAQASEESIDIQRVLMGAKLGRELKSVF